MKFRIIRRTIVVTTIVVLLLAIAGMVFFANVFPKEKRVTVLPEDVPAVDDPAFARALVHLLGRGLYEGNEIEVFRNGDEIFPAKLEAIRNANHSITVETYEFWGETLPPKLGAALIERARAGVPVHFIMDFVGSVGADQTDVDRMEEGGVDVVRWRKPSWYQSTRFNHRTHRKILVIDGQVAFTGGANLADAWLAPEEEGGMRDNHFRLTGPIVGELQGAFMDNWLKATGEILLGDAYFPPLEPVGDLATQAVVSSPREGTHYIRPLYLLAIAAAREHLRFSTAYFYPDPMVEEALIRARERGVTVEILAPGEETEKTWVRYASRNRWGNLLEAGVRIYEYTGPMYHAKALIVDDHFITIGSANFDNRSFRINDEANVNVFDSGFTRKMIENFERDLESTVEYDLAKWEARGFRERAIGWLGNLIGPHL